MKIEEIRKGAPFGATGYVNVGNLGIAYTKHINGVLHYYCDPIYEWVEIKCDDDLIKPLN